MVRLTERREFWVLRGGRAVYAPGHYTKESAESLARSESGLYPQSIVRVVQEVSAFIKEPEASTKKRKALMGAPFITTDLAPKTLVHLLNAAFGTLRRRGLYPAKVAVDVRVDIEGKPHQFTVVGENPDA